MELLARIASSVAQTLKYLVWPAEKVASDRSSSSGITKSMSVNHKLFKNWRWLWLQQWQQQDHAEKSERAKQQLQHSKTATNAAWNKATRHNNHLAANDCDDNGKWQPQWHWQHCGATNSIRQQQQAMAAAFARAQQLQIINQKSI